MGGFLARARASLANWIAPERGRGAGRLTPGRTMRAGYDAAQTTADNRRHWANADALSANAAASVSVRSTLRARARYEVANNCYAKGMVWTLAHDCIGTGPRIQLATENNEDNMLAERLFSDWMRAANLAAKLRTMRVAKAVDGEAFAMLTSNEGLADRVKLDIRLIEADQIASPYFTLIPSAIPQVDGIVFDAAGNPIEYHLLDQHPGERSSVGRSYKTYPADAIIHWFRVERPGQYRGLPEIMAGLPLYAQLRRWTKATIQAAETAASLAAIMETTLPEGGEAADVDPMAEMDVEHGSAIFAPEGWTAKQMKAEHPSSTYDTGKRELINEIGREQNMSFNIAAGNSSGYNYSSGRLDHQMYFRSVGIEQSDCERAVLARIADQWFREAALIEGYLPQAMRSRTTPRYYWTWDGPTELDTEKEANATAQRLRNRTTNLKIEWAKHGMDWREGIDQLAKEIEYLTEKGISIDEAAAAVARQGNQSDKGATQ